MTWWRTSGRRWDKPTADHSRWTVFALLRWFRFHACRSSAIQYRCHGCHRGGTLRPYLADMIALSTLRVPVTAAFLLLIGLQANAQDPATAGGFNCLANHPAQLAAHLAADPGARAAAEEAKARLDAHAATFQAQRGGGSSYVIPVVFHIIHNNGPENISDAQVYDAIRVLNEDYNQQNPDWTNVNPAFLDLVADVGFEFRLAQLDPQGNCTNGITRTVSTQTNNGDFEMTQLIQWPRERYMNVWVAASASGAAGYTYYPMWLDNWPKADGIVLLHSYVGSIGTSAVSRSRVLSHEVGHWLNLMHCWGDSNEPGSEFNCFDDDQVTDTPLTQGWTACSLNGSSCGSPVDNVENYMEYSYCAKMFTRGQGERMLVALTSNVAQRNELWAPSNLQQTGVLGTPQLCVAQFTAAQREVCAGTTVAFADISYNGVQQRTWSFPGGEPSTSDQAQPNIVYSTPGTWPVSLTVSDGTSTLETSATAYITVLPDPGAAPPVVEGFEQLQTLAGSPWTVQDPDNDGGFAITTAAAYTGSQSVRLLNFATQAGQMDALTSTSFDMSDAVDINLSFRYAFARRNNNNNDVLRVYVSNSCGATWSMRKVLRADNTTSNILATADAVGGTFVPNGQSEWQQSIVDNISTGFHTSDFRIRFEFESDGGNALYLDDININGMPVGLEENDGPTMGLRIMPNPAQNDAYVHLDPRISGPVQIDLLDAAGRVVRQFPGTNGSRSGSAIRLDLNGLSGGLYLVRCQQGSQVFVERLAVEP